MRVVCYVLLVCFVVCRSLLLVVGVCRCSLFVACCLLLVVCFACSLLFVVGCWLFVDRWPLFVGVCGVSLLFVVERGCVLFVGC